MTEVVLDASVIAKWFRGPSSGPTSGMGERHVEQARSLRDAFARGDLTVVVPSLLSLELINVAGRKWGWEHVRLERLAITLGELGFDWVEPGLRAVARWTALGLTAYDAAYVAVAEEHETSLVTDDDRVLAAAPGVAVALADR